ncbi:MAG TPA: hypothetical protein PKK95_09250, partial [Vicinamibacterales bacterium]|nr:hypothetical protein [Vicinamibacterales bacterium]
KQDTPIVAPGVDPADQVGVVFHEGANIEHRKPGLVYVIDRALAHHYVEVAKVAEYSDKAPPPPPREPNPPRPNDRAMQSPPRGRKGPEER